MKTKNIPALFMALICIGFLTSCDMVNDFIESRTRPITLIQLYNSNLEKNMKLVPNDTLYVEARGLVPGKMYTIECLDPSGNTITEILTQADENGVINPSPLWYDAGFKINEDGQIYLPETIEASAFNVRVFDDEQITDFQLPFFFVSDPSSMDRPQPVVMAGRRVDGSFLLENAFYSSEADFSAYTEIENPETLKKLYVKVKELEPLPGGSDADIVRLWILRFPGEVFQDGADLSQYAWFYKDISVSDLNSASEGIHISWPVIDNDGDTVADEEIEPDTPIDTGNPPSNVTLVDELPEWAEGRSFSVFLDMLDEENSEPGIFQIKKEGTETSFIDAIDGNGVAGFIVKEPPKVFADYIPMNLASGGRFRWSYNYDTGRWEYDYDYRNEFNYMGYDTVWSSHSGEFWGRGVKVIWNPYLTPAGWEASGEEMPSSFYGQVVDVYIVDSTHELYKDTSIVPADGTGGKRRVPVQYGCSNGWWQQTIWRTPISQDFLGSYMIVVDMDRSGTITADDLVDNLKKDFQADDSDVYANVWKEDDEFIGFKIVDSY